MAAKEDTPAFHLGLSQAKCPRYFVGLGRAHRRAVIDLDHAAGQVQAQGVQSPVVHIHRHRLVVVQVGQGDAVGVDQGFVAVQAESLGRRLDRGPFDNDEGAVLPG